jgi:hypothetical protein
MGLVDFVCLPEGLDATIADAIAEFDDTTPDGILLARRLLDESFELPYEEFIGGFLAAQHKATGSDAFAKSVKNAHATDTPQGKGK